MPRFDLAGNPMPELGDAPPPAPTPLPFSPAAPFPETRRPSSLPPIPAPGARTPLAPKTPAPPAPLPPAAPSSPQSILTRGVVQETPAQKARAYAGLVATLVALILATYAVAAIPAPLIPAPASYTKHTVEKGGFTYDAPDGWARRRIAEDGLVLVLYQKTQATLEVEYAPSGPNGAPNLDLDDAHTMNLTLLRQDSGGLDIHDQPAQPVTSGLGEGRLSEWTAQAGMTHLHGCSATLVGPGVVAFVTGFCPERDWASLQPAFRHVIQGAAPLAAPGQAGQTGGQ